MQADLLDDGKTLIPSVLAAVIGHWSQDGNLHPANFSDLPRRNFVTYESSGEIWSTLIKMYTSQGQCILIFEESENEGKVLMYSRIPCNHGNWNIQQQHAALQGLYIYAHLYCIAHKFVTH